MKQNNYWNNSINYNNNLKTKKLMKYKLLRFSLLSVVALLCGWLSPAWADSVVLSTPDASVATHSDADGIITITDATENTGIQVGSGSLSYGTNLSATPMKLSGSRQFNLTYSDKVTITKVTLYGTSNKSDAEATLGPDKNDRTSLGTLPKKGEAPVAIDITNVTGLNASVQFLAIIVVEYSSTAPSLSVSPKTISLALNPSRQEASETFTLTGKNLTDGNYSLTVPNIAGLNVTPQSFTVANGAVNQEFTVTYASRADVAKATTDISATVGDLTATVEVTYQSRATAYTQSTVSAEATWDWTKLTETAELTDDTTPSKSDEFLLADLDDRITFNEAFGDPTAIMMSGMQYPSRSGFAQGTTIKFKTSVPGTISVDFSNTGGDDRPDRYLNVNGKNTTFKSNSTTKVSATDIAVPAGEVVLMGNEVNNEATNGFMPNMLRWYKITFTPGDEPVEPQPHDPVTLTWSYDDENPIPTTSPDNGLYFAGYVNDAAGTNNGMHGVKLNSSGKAFFEKPAVEGTLTLTFGNRQKADAYAVNVYACTVTDGTATKGDLIGEVSVAESPGTGSIDIAADVTGIYIERKTSAEGVLQKIVFKEKVPRTFQDFEITNDELKGTYDPSKLPTGVDFSGTPHNDSHGYQNATIVVPTDGGAVKFTIGGCQYANPATFTVTDAEGKTVATLDQKTPGCYHKGGTVTYFYTGEATTLTFGPMAYLPYFKAEATDVQEVTVTFKDQNGNVLGTTTVFEGEALGEVPYTEADLTIPSGQKFRGWTYTNGVKVKATDIVSGSITVKASVTPIETVTEGSIQTYDLTKSTFYPEDHETITMDNAVWHDSQHGFSVANGSTISVQTAGKAQVVVTLCQHSSEGTVTVKDANGNPVGEGFNAKVATCGTTAVVNYDGEATWLTFTFSATAYIHSIKVYNVTDFVEKDEESGWYIVPANDGVGLVLALNAASQEANGANIFLPNGTYDLGETVLTAIGGKNVSLIGESMEGVIIKNAPPVAIEGLKTTATLHNTGENLYLQDLTIQNALDYYSAGSAGRGIAFWDEGKHTIAKNVKLLSYQDTYLSTVNQQFYWETSEIHGAVDFICGGSDVFFESTKIVTESRAATGKSGEATITAPQPGTQELFGYVFNNCTIENNAAKFNLGRAWGGNNGNGPKQAYLNTTIMQPDEIIDTRFTTAGMNEAAKSFKEYNSMDSEGNPISPASNILKFTHSTGDYEYETILSDAEAANYALDKVFTGWAPNEIATQVEAPTATLEDGTIKWEAVSGATAYAIFKDGELLTIVGSEATSYTIEESTSGAPSLEGDTATPVYTLRAANERGGFGEPKEVTVADGINRLNIDQNGDVKLYDLQGRRIMTPTTGVYIVNGKKVVIK